MGWISSRCLSLLSSYSHLHRKGRVTQIIYRVRVFSYSPTFHKVKTLYRHRLLSYTLNHRPLSGKHSQLISDYINCLLILYVYVSYASVFLVYVSYVSVIFFIAKYCTYLVIFRLDHLHESSTCFGL